MQQQLVRIHRRSSVVDPQPPRYRCLLRLLVIVCVCLSCSRHSLAQLNRLPRLCVTTDIGGDPDDTQSLVRLMLYVNHFDVQCLIASSSGVPGQLSLPATRTDLIRQVVDAYAKVRPNLMRHEKGWPTAGDLTAKIKTGNRLRGVDNVGEGHDTEASRWIIQKVDLSSPLDPLDVAIWGGQTDLAQALWRVKHDRTPKQFQEFLRRLRVYEIGDQDHLNDWLHAEAPGLYMIDSMAPAGQDQRDSTYRGMYLGGDESLTSDQWLVKNGFDVSVLGRIYPRKAWTEPNPYSTMKEGDTPSWFFFLSKGHNDPNDPSKPGWGGQYKKMKDGWWHDLAHHPRSTVYRWRPEFQVDFARRMHWTIR